MKPAWSIFAKVGGAALPPNQLVTASAGKECGWAVHYDLWLDTFQRGEYEPSNSFGGAHCLTACCNDPTCDGLALMSNEEYQCYKYKGLPIALSQRTGMDLGDGQWLLKKKPAWSIFVKTRTAIAQTAKPNERHMDPMNIEVGDAVMARLTDLKGGS